MYLSNLIILGLLIKVLSDKFNLSAINAFGQNIIVPEHLKEIQYTD